MRRQHRIITCPLGSEIYINFLQTKPWCHFLWVFRVWMGCRKGEICDWMDSWSFDSCMFGSGSCDVMDCFQMERTTESAEVCTCKYTHWFFYLQYRIEQLFQKSDGLVLTDVDQSWKTTRKFNFVDQKKLWNYWQESYKNISYCIFVWPFISWIQISWDFFAPWKQSTTLISQFYRHQKQQVRTKIILVSTLHWFVDDIVQRSGKFANIYWAGLRGPQVF